MFIFALGIGMYSYVIFALGIFQYLYPLTILSVTVTFCLLFVLFGYYNRHKFQSIASFKLFVNNTSVLALLGMLCLQAIVNLIGSLGPEIGFDALWYHLTLPKLYLLHHAIYHIPGGLLYYSDMPKLGEMLYVSALSIHSEIAAKLLHFTFGLLVVMSLYKLSRCFVSPLYALLICLVFYTNLVVGWESISAYVDLIRTYFELLAMYYFVMWIKVQKNSLLVFSSILLGLAITTKLIAIGSFIIFLPLILYYTHKNKKSILESIIFSVIYIVIALCVPLPWFIFSYIHTGNALYPLFTSLYHVTISPLLLNPVTIISTFWNTFTHASDPVSPIYLAFLPLFIVPLKKEERFLVFMSLLALVSWYVTPQTGGGRFLLPYLPILSLTVVVFLKQVQNQNLKKFYIGIIIIVSFISMLYRGIANVKYIPVLTGQESKTVFLTKYLNFSFGDFYDTDNYFSSHITPHDTVLLIGFHNLYYVKFPFIDSSWIKKGDRFNYLATQSTSLPKTYAHMRKIYSNSTTHIHLYALPNQQWVTYF